MDLLMGEFVKCTEVYITYFQNITYSSCFMYFILKQVKKIKQEKGSV